MELLPSAEAAARLGRLQARMQESSIDAVFVQQNADLYYFSGTVQAGLLCLPASGEPVYLVQKSAARARMESPWERVVAATSLKKAEGLLADSGVRGLATVGLELDVLPAGHFLRLQALFPQTRFVDASEMIRQVRMIKSPYEVDRIRRAARFLRQAFGEIPGWAVPGATELEVAARIEGFLRQLGHQGLIRARGFNFEIGYGAISAGPSAGYPTFLPGPVGSLGLYPAVPNGASRRPLERGQTLMADIVAGFGGYVADITRTFELGRVSEEMHRAHSFLLDLMRAVEEMLKPGTLCSDIYRYAMTRVQETPYATAFMGAGDSRVRFVGHGIGLEIDELPVLAANCDVPLEAGMTIALEPKIFFPDGGVGIENTYWISDGGPQNLTDYPEEMIPVPF
jgi:Xaa-Pro dipeptidase